MRGLRGAIVLACTLAVMVGCLGNTRRMEQRPTVADQTSFQTMPEDSVVPPLHGGSERSLRSLQAGQVHSLSVRAQYRGVLFYNGPRKKKLVALTFDDGPDTKYTPQILSVLKRYHVKATFFIMGVRARAHPQMVRRIGKDGHAIGNHSWDHLDFVRLNSAHSRWEVSLTDQMLHDILGYYPSMFRPPYGAATANNLHQLQAMGYKVIDWSVDTRDWAGTPVDGILDKVHREVYPGGIILEHCAGGPREDLSNTVQALPRIIESLRSRGYKFVTVPELLGISERK